MNTSSAFPFRTASGFRPLRGLHVGHYGAVIRDIRQLQYARQGCSFVFIADHHSRSRWSEPADFVNGHKRTIMLARQLIAIGVDPEYSVIYRQSDLPELFEFMWFLSGIAPHGKLKRGHAVSSATSPTVGVYLYPLLMVADILSLRATQAIVGKDQKMHVELARQVAGKLQTIFGPDFLPVPEFHSQSPKLYRGIKAADHNTKMDGEISNDIPLFDDDDVVEDRIHAIQTSPVAHNEPLETENSLILSYAEAIGGPEEQASFSADFQSGNYGYATMKKRLHELFMDTFSAARASYPKISDAYAEEVLRLGGLEARRAVADLIDDVRRHISVSV